LGERRLLRIKRLKGEAVERRFVKISFLGVDFFTTSGRGLQALYDCGSGGHERARRKKVREKNKRPVKSGCPGKVE